MKWDALAVDPLVQLFATGFLAIVFARAIFEKAGAYAIYVATLRDYRLTPAPFVPFVAAILLAAEIAAMLLLLWPATRSLGALLAAGLLGLYALAMSLALAAGRTQIECGCGGDGQTVSAGLVGRNLVLIALALVLLAPPASRATGIVDTLGAACAILIAWLALAAAEKTIDNAAAARRLRSESFL
ncbi:MAG: MauE/DoxX family redox-associated membrane protein [Beijerinckiaceae bacterium]